MDVLQTRSQLQLNNVDVNVARNLGRARPVKEAILKKIMMRVTIPHDLYT